MDVMPLRYVRVVSLLICAWNVENSDLNTPSNFNFLSRNHSLLNSHCSAELRLKYDTLSRKCDNKLSNKFVRERRTLTSIFETYPSPNSELATSPSVCAMKILDWCELVLSRQYIESVSVTKDSLNTLKGTNIEYPPPPFALYSNKLKLYSLSISKSFPFILTLELFFFLQHL